MMKIIDGDKLAKDREVDLKIKVDQLRKKGIKLKLVTMVMEDDEAGLLYSRLKKEAGERIGIELEKKIVGDIAADKIVKLVEKYNKDDKVKGIMIQRPSMRWGKSKRMNRQEFEDWWKQIVGVIDSEKDVDGLREQSKFLMAVVKAVMLVEKESDKKWGNAAVVGSKGMIGRKLIEYLEKRDVDVKGFDLGDDLNKELIKADWIISAAGRENLIKKEMIKEGTGIIDVGWPKGDVDFDSVKEKAGVITPVPGGIGPLTVVSLLENLVKSVYIKD